VRRMNIAILVIALLAMVGAGAGIGLATTASASTHTRTTASGTASGAVSATVSATKDVKYVLFDCNSGPEVEPASYVAFCADDGAGLQQLHWTSWTPKLASGYGTMYENDCIPYCAAGHVYDYPALVVLWGSATVKGHPAERRYQWLTLIFTGKRPPVYNLVHGKLTATHPATQTWPTDPA
jgi:hypothetical protein